LNENPREIGGFLSGFAMLADVTQAGDDVRLRLVIRI
jgi:hypothetical protein